MKSLALLLFVAWCHQAVLSVEVPVYEKCPEGAVEPMKKLLCYYEGLTTVDKINPCLCTHIVYTASARVGDDFSLHVYKDNERNTHALRQRNPTLKIVLSVASNASQSDALAKSDAKRQQLVQSVVTYVAEAGVDGVELNFEMSTKGGADAKENFAEFMKLLREKIDSADVAQSRQKRDYSVTENQDDDSTTEWSTNKRNATATKKAKALATSSRRKSKVTERDADSKSKIVFLRVPIEPEVIAKRFDLKFIAKYIDNFVVATDNITDASEKGVTYHPSRLMGISDILNMDSMLDLLTGLGAPHSKLIVSLPATTTLFTLADDSKTTPRSPVTGLPSTINQAKMCSMLMEGGWTMERDEDLTAPYAFRNNTWMAFEDGISAGIKGKYVVLRDLGGAALFQLDDEDTVGACRNVSDAQDPSLLASLHFTFTNLARKSRQALLQTLQEEIHESTLINYSGDVHLSPYRIVRVVDLAGAVHVVRKDAKTEFECSRQGYFSHPLGCNRFYRCVKFNQYTPDYTVFEYDCPAGLAFDERWEVCVWPGSLPQGSPCTGSSEIAPVPRARYSCPTVEGYYADPENCRWFFACLDHARDGSPLTAYEFRCPFGLVFDEKKLLCDWPWSVEGCGASGKAIFVGQAGFGYSAHSAAANLQVNAGAHFESSHFASAYESNAASFSSSESFGNGGSVSSSGANGYIAASDADSGSYYEGRDTASYGSYPDYLVSGGRIEQSGGVILGEHVKSSAGIVGVGNAYSGSFSSYESGSQHGNEFHGASFEATKIVAPAAPVLAKVPAVSVTSYENANAHYEAGSYQGGDIHEQAGFYQSTAAPIVQHVSYSPPVEQVVVKQEQVVVKQPVVEQQVFYQSTPRPIQQVVVKQPTPVAYVAPSAVLKQEFVSFRQPIVQKTIVEPAVSYFAQPSPRPIEQVVVKQPVLQEVQYQQQIVQPVVQPVVEVKEPQVFFQSTPRPIVKQVEIQQPIVEQPQVFYHSTPRPIVKQVEIQAPIVEQPQVFYQSTPRPIVKQVEIQTPIVQQPQVFYQSTPRPIVKQVEIQTPIVQQPQVFYQSTPRPIVKQVEIQTPIVQQPQVFYHSTPRPIVKQVEIQTPIVQQPQVFYQSTPRPIVKQVEIQQPIIHQQIVQEPQPQVFYQSSPRPVVKQVQYQTPIVQQQIVQEPIVAYKQPVSYREPQIFFQSSPPKPIVKQVQYQTPIVQQKIVEQPQIFYQSTPRPIVKQVQYQTPIVQQQIVQEPQVFYQSTPRPIVKQVEYQQPIIEQKIVEQPPVFYQSTPRPIVKQVQYQAPIVQQQIVQEPEPQVFYQSTPRPIVKQVQYQTPIVPKIVEQPQVFYQSTPRPIVKQVQYQAPIVQQQIVQEPEPQVFYQSTPRPIVKQVQYQAPIVPKIVEQPQVFYQSTPRPIVKQVEYQAPIIEQKIVEQPQVFYQSTPRPIVKQVEYQQPIIEQKIVEQPQVFYQSTHRPIVKQVEYQQPIIEQKIVEQPPVFYQSTPRPIVKQVQYQAPIVQQIVQTPKPTVYYSQTSPAPIVKQVTYRPRYQQVTEQAYVAPTVVAQTYQTEGEFAGYSYSAPTPQYKVSTTSAPSTYQRHQIFETRQQEVSVSDNGEYGNINQAEIASVQVSTPAPVVVQRYENERRQEQQYKQVEKAQVYDAYKNVQLEREYLPVKTEGQAQQSWTSYDSRYDTKDASTAQFVNEGLTDLGYEEKYEGKYEEKYEEREQEEYVEKVTSKPAVFEQYFRETSPPKVFTTTQRPVTYSAPEYLPPSSTKILEATTFRYEQRPRFKAVKKQKVIADVDALLDQYSGNFGGIVSSNEGFISDVIADDLAGKKTVDVTTPEYVEVTTFRPRKKSRKRPTTTTAKYEEDDDSEEEEVEIKKSKQPVVVVTQLSDANPLLIAKLGAKCTCQSERVSLRKKNRNRNGGDNRPVPSGAYAADLVDSVPGDYDDNNQVVTSTFVPVSKDGGDVPVVRIRPSKRPTVSRVPSDIGVDALVAKTRRPQVNVEVDSLPNIADLEQRYVKSGLRNRGYQYRKPKIPVVIDIDDDSDKENDGPSSTLQPIVVEGPSSIPVVTRRPASNLDFGRFPQEKTFKPIVVQEPFTLVTKRPYIADGQSSNVAYGPEVIRRRPESARRRPVVTVDGDDEAVRTEGQRRRPESARRGSGNAAEGETVKIAGKSFDRYGPGGWRSVDETLQGSVDCQRPGLFRHPKYCNKFYACHWDNWKSRYTLHVFNCPVHLSYDTSLGACNWPTKGPACVDDNLLV